MPRFFFHICWPKVWELDPHGTEYASPNEAVEGAKEAAAYLAKADKRGAALVRSERVLEVCDITGRVLATLPIREGDRSLRKKEELSMPVASPPKRHKRSCKA